MRIHLDPEYLIDGDERSVNLIRLRTVTGDSARGRAPKAENIGTQREEVCGFYATLAQACEGYLRYRVQGSDATTAEQLIALTEAAVNVIVEATKDIPREAVAK